MIFQQPNFLGCLEPAPDARGGRERGGRARPIAHVDLMSLGVLEAPGAYGCAIAIGEGQAAGNWPSYGGPHYGFLAARSEFVRRMPGRIVGETRRPGRAARVRAHAADARAAHPPREGDVEHHDEPDAARARRARDALVARARRGCARWGRRASRSRSTRASAFRSSRRSTRARSRRSRSARRSPPARSSAARASAACIPGYALGRDYEGMDDVLLVAVTEKRTRRGHRPPRGGARGGLPMTRARARLADAPLIFERSRAGPPRRAAAAARPARAGAARRRCAGARRRGCPSSPSRSSSATSPRSPTARSASTRASTRSAPAR